MNITDYLRTALLNHALGVATFTPPTTVWAGLFAALPSTSAGGGTEVSAADYLRVATTWNLAAVGSISNSLQIRFPASGLTQSSWGAALGLGLFDAPTSGNLLFYGPLSAQVTLSLGDEVSIGPSNLTIGLG